MTTGSIPCYLCQNFASDRINGDEVRKFDELFVNNLQTSDLNLWVGRGQEWVAARVGSEHGPRESRTIDEIRKISPQCKVEVLTPDFQGEEYALNLIFQMHNFFWVIAVPIYWVLSLLYQRLRQA